jgi:hypothetical protein
MRLVSEPTLVVDESRRRISVGRWSARPLWIRRPPPSAPALTSALLRIGPAVHLLITVDEAAANASPHVELWAHEPDRSDGLMLVYRGDDAVGIARIPICGCGDRGCAHAGRQFATTVAAADLPGVVDLLASLAPIPLPPESG